MELQLRLAGFRGTVWDGRFGPGTELQVVTFQRDVMREQAPEPDGVAGPKIFRALEQFIRDYPIAREKLKCNRGLLDGFGRGLGRDSYQPGQPQQGRYYRYEYLGIHQAILHTY